LEEESRKHSERIERDLDVVDFFKFSAEEFLYEYAALGKPLIIKNSTTKWPLPSKFWSIELLERFFGDSEYVVRKGDDYTSMQTRSETFTSYIASLRKSSFNVFESQDLDCTTQEIDASWYGANNWIPPGLIPYIDIPKYYPSWTSRMLDTKIWVGPEGTGAHLHSDMHDNFVVQLIGEKRFTLIAPHHRASLGATSFTSNLMSSPIDIHNIEASRYPEAALLKEKGKIFEYTLQPW